MPLAALTSNVARLDMNERS